MSTALQASCERQLGRHFDMALRRISRRCVRVWYNCGRLDEVLSEVLAEFRQCELVYAIDTDGRQVSSNIHADAIDHDAYGQDLSQRPIAVRLSMLGNAAFCGAFLVDTYISRVTRRPCVTVMCGVTSGSTLIGFIAADFDPAELRDGHVLVAASRRRHAAGTPSGTAGKTLSRDCARSDC